MDYIVLTISSAIVPKDSHSCAYKVPVSVKSYISETGGMAQEIGTGMETSLRPDCWCWYSCQELKTLAMWEPSIPQRDV